MRALYKAEAAKALERAEKIKTFKQDIKPVAKNEFAEGSEYPSCRHSRRSADMLDLYRRAALRPAEVVAHQSGLLSDLGFARETLAFVGVGDTYV